MNNYVNRDDLKKDLLGYASCMYRPTLMARIKVLEVLDNIPSIKIVHCDDCANVDDCEITHLLGDNGFCSEGVANAEA